jgi:cellulase
VLVYLSPAFAPIMKLSNTILYASVLTVVSAHSIFVQVTAEGTTYPISYGIRDPSYDGPINDVTSNDIVCNGGPNPTTASSNIINVKAGDTIGATWRHGLTSTAENDPVYVIDPSHKGPVMAYLKKVGDATTDTGIGDGWFKIQQQGYDPATAIWGIDTLIANAGVQSITIPTCIPNGQYLLRAELIALHGAASSLGAQFYMECAQLNITGGTGTTGPPTVAFPGAYGQSDPGILLNIYYPTITTYTIPGPTQFTCGGAAATSKPSSTVKTSTTSTTLVTSTKPSTTAKSSSAATTTSPVTSSTKTTSKVTTSTAAATGAPLYGQCGGSGWTGPTTCASGTCTYSSAYYSQCLP